MNKAIKFTIVFIVLTALLSVVGIAAFGGLGKMSFDIIGNITSGNAYYEERCVDVTQYLTQGYTASGTDAFGCAIAVKIQITNILPMFKYCDIHNSMDYAFGFPDDLRAVCKAMGARTTKFINCRQYGAPSSYPSSYTSPYCELTQVVDTKGGMERVLNYCTFAQNDLLVGESFAGGQTINKFSLRYPIKSFCRAHPTIITHDATKTSETSTNVPEQLLNGSSVTISSGDTMTIFYVIENNYQLPTICDSNNNLALDVNSNLSIGTCKSTLGFAYICSQGQYDALRGVCVVQPQSQTICAQGVYDVLSGMCIYNPPINVDCGSNSCFYSVDRNICSCYTQNEFVCPTGFTLKQPTQTQCTQIGGTWQICPQCPIDKICPSEICSPQCSIGQKCTWDSPLITDCQHANATIINNQCHINGITVTVCPTGTTYNGNLDRCISTPATVDKCSDGSTPTINNITGAKECIKLVPTITLCNTNGAVIVDNKCYINGTQTIVCPTGATIVNGQCYINGAVIVSCPAGYTLTNGKCYTNGTTITVCPSGSAFDALLNKCVYAPAVTTVCSDGALVVKNPTTGKDECISYPQRFISCPGNYTYNQAIDKCVPSVVVYDEKSDKFVTYVSYQIPENKDTSKNVVVVFISAIMGAIGATASVAKKF